MARLHHNLLQAVLDADITDVATTITFTAPLREWGEDNIATITAPDILAIRIGYELLHVTAYTSGASSATVLRGQEGSTATAHAEGDAIRHVPTADDFGASGAYTPGGTDVAVADGGTGASTASGARTNLGLVIGTDILGMGGGTLSGDLSVPDEAYDATGWNGSLEVPTKNAVRDKIETLATGSVSDTAYGSGWNGDTTTAPSKNAVYDKIETLVGSAPISIDNISDFNTQYGTGITAYDEEFTGTGSSLPSGWSWLNQGSSVFDLRFSAGVITLPSSTTQMRGLIRNLPSESTWTAWGSASMSLAIPASSSMIGVVLRQSSNSKIVVGRLVPGFGWFTSTYDSAAGLASGANVKTVTGGVVDASRVVWKLRRNSATSYDFEISTDGGITFAQMDMGRNPTTITPDQIGFIWNNEASGWVMEGAAHWFRVR